MTTATLTAKIASSQLDEFDVSRVHRFTVSEYHRLIELGVFKPESRVELINGIVVKKMSQNPPHSVTICQVIDLLNAVLPREFVIRSQLPITLALSEPEPDIAVVLGPHSRYKKRHPTPSDIGLIVEIADESLSRDRRAKGLIYADAMIVEYWIVNLADNTVEIYSKPRQGKQPRFAKDGHYTKSQQVPLTLAGKKIADLSFRDILS